MTEENNQKDFDSPIYTLIKLGNYRKANELLNQEEIRKCLPERVYEDYNRVVQKNLEKGLD